MLHPKMINRTMHSRIIGYTIRKKSFWFKNWWLVYLWNKDQFMLPLYLSVSFCLYHVSFYKAVGQEQSTTVCRILKWLLIQLHIVRKKIILTAYLLTYLKNLCHTLMQKKVSCLLFIWNSFLFHVIQYLYHGLL